MPETILVPDIKIDGTTLEILDPDADLVELRVSRSSGAAASAQLRLDMTDTDGDSIQIGSELVIDVVSLDGVQAGGSIFIGSVTSIGIEIEARRTQLVVGAHDASYPLGQATVATSRLSMSASAIISSIASDFGLSADVDDVLGTDTLDHVQETGTAHQFITEIARSFGCEWFVTGDTLVVQRRTATNPITIKGDADLRRFTARFSAIDQASTISVRQWDSDTRQVVASTKDLSATAELARSNVPITTRGRSQNKAPQAPGAGVAIAGPLARTIDPEVLAVGVVGRHEAAMLTGRGEVDVRSELVPGSRIELEGVKTEWNGTYYVTSVEHVFGDNKPFVSRFTVGALEPTSLVDMFGSGSAGTRDRLATSLAIGVVTDNEDPDGLNRVKFRLPALSDTNESWWARVVSAGAGPGRGWAIVPEVDDEVVVAFEHGDIQRPFVLGGLWNGTDAVPTVQDQIVNGQVDSRSFTSRLGHRIEFRDGGGEDAQYISLTLDNTTTKLYLGADKIELHSADKAIQVKTNDATIDLTEQGDITLKANNIKIEASQNIDLKAGGNVTVEGSTNASVKAGASATFEGSASATLKAGGNVTVQGAMVGIN